MPRLRSGWGGRWTVPRSNGESPLVISFLYHWRVIVRSEGEPFPDPVHEVSFHRYRFDLAWPEAQVAVECEGGTWSRGSHVRGKRYASDCRKYNRAQEEGWIVLRFTTDMLKADGPGAVRQVLRVLRGRQTNAPTKPR